MVKKILRRRGTSLSGLFALLLLCGVGLATPSSASSQIDNSVQREIRTYLAEHPGAVQTAPYQVAFHGGSVIMNFVPPGETKVSGDLALRPDLRRAAFESRGKEAGGNVEPLTATADWKNCPRGLTDQWYCVYEHANWGGRMLQFKDCSSSGYYNYLSQYGFANMTSSWVNTKAAGSVNAYGSGSAYLWHESEESMSSNVGATNNDRAWYLVCKF